MAIITSSVETQKIMGIEKAKGKHRSHALSRCYGGVCPLNEGQKVTLSVEMKEHGKPVLKHYGTALIRSIVEMSFKMRSSDTAMSNRLAVGEGFTNAQGWGLYYGRDGISPDAVFHRLQFDQIKLVTDGALTQTGARTTSSSRPSTQPQSQHVGETKTIGTVDDLDTFDRDMFG